ncbi:MAG: tRNA (adenosine(37)-N6)-threonylcarbamoyltransferase complex ATPase subunit type 1 TsaE [Bacteroidota bacterium]|nr:tRNA (adenosine(37)-N6)-threonylcarbamoyltransferase complex ATPase subunit type 1 TsaE [Bacteroidota bacterium]
MQYIIKQEKELRLAAKELLASFPEERVFSFYGKMGAGKTTLIKELCLALNVDDVVNSPTFAIINEYLTKQDESVFHFDFYRLKDAGEAMQIGFEDYIYSGNYCFMEWPERVEELLPEKYVYVSIIEQEDGTRVISARLSCE